MTAAKSSGLAGALREKALDFFYSEANVVTEFEGWQVAEASLFPDPRFRNAEKLGEFARGQQCTRGGAEAPSYPQPDYFRRTCRWCGCDFQDLASEHWLVSR
jgi:hypothetical protein